MISVGQTLICIVVLLTNTLDVLASPCPMGNQTHRRFKRHFILERVDNAYENIKLAMVHECNEGILLPPWMPQSNLTGTQRSLRGLVYFLILCFIFLGVSIISERFIASIEKITSTQRIVTVKGANFSERKYTVRIWSDAVANSTLMALGTSAPAISLAVIEICGKNFNSGLLGPGTIIGSYAFNLFVVVGICMIEVPYTHKLRIKNYRVFLVGAISSLFAFVWILFIVAVVSPGIIELWEAILTFLIYPFIVVWAFVAESHRLCYRSKKKLRPNHRLTPVEVTYPKGLEEDMIAFEEARAEYIMLLTTLRREHPEADLEQIEMMVQERMITQGNRSRAFYRIHATRKMIGNGNLMRKIQERAQNDINEVKANIQDEDSDEEHDAPVRIYFEPGHYTVLENCGEFQLRVIRRGDLTGQSTVDFETREGTANSIADFVAKRGRLTFPPGVDEQRITIEIIDDEIFEEDEYFYVHLMNPSEGVILVVPNIATVMILDTDHCGTFAFTEAEAEIAESVGILELSVKRYSGTSGEITVTYWTLDDTALDGRDYEGIRGDLVFNTNINEQVISIAIVEASSYQKDVTFYVRIGEPKLSHTDAVRFFGPELADRCEHLNDETRHQFSPAELATLFRLPRLGSRVICKVRIRESKEFKQTVDQLVAKANTSAILGTSSWQEQFRDALTVVPSDETEFDCIGPATEDEMVPKCIDYISHFATLFWKVPFALVPPSQIWGGYPTFIISLLIIIILMIIVYDAAVYFGCTVGNPDLVTAICIVSVGTSLPDTFASVIAARQDLTADYCFSSVFIPAALNVFFGLGLAWTMCAIYHMVEGTEFQIASTNLDFSLILLLILACIPYGILLYRRLSFSIQSELGGKAGLKWLHGSCFFLLWIIFIVLVSLIAHNVIKM